MCRQTQAEIPHSNPTLPDRQLMCAGANERPLFNVQEFPQDA